MAKRELKISIVGDSRSIEKAFGRSAAAGSSFEKRLLGISKKSAVALGAAGVASAGLGVKLVKMAGDAAEVESKFKVVFGREMPRMVKQLDAFSKATGASRYELRQQTADMGALLAPLVGNTKAAGDMSVQFTKLATDLSSFNNVPTADALAAIRSGLVGESEPLRAFGVLLNEGAVKAEAYRSGIAKVGAELTEQQKVQARANLIMAQTTLAQGDATRTADSFTNQLRRLKNAVSDTAVDLGAKLLPAATGVLTRLNEWGPALAQKVQPRLDALSRWARDNEDEFRQLFADMKTGAERAGTAVAGIGKGADTAAQKMGGWSSAFEMILSGYLATKFAAVLAKLHGAAGKGGILAALTKIKALGPTIAIAVVIDLAINEEHRSKIARWAELLSQNVGLNDPRWFPVLGIFAGKPRQGGSSSGPGTQIAGMTPGTSSLLGAVGGQEALSGSLLGSTVGGKHTKNSYHYRGQALDLEPTIGIWNMLYPNRFRFAELLGPWGLYNWGIRFYNDELQRGHMNHIHVAFTGGPGIVEKLFGGGGGGSQAGSAPSGGGATPSPTPSPAPAAATPKKKIDITSAVDFSQLKARMADRFQEALDRARQRVSDSRAAFGAAFGTVADKMLRVFDAKTEQLLARARAKVAGFGFEIGVGEETPAEKRLREQRDAREDASLQQALAAATTAEERAAAQAAIDERALEKQAQAERTAADAALEAERRRIESEREVKREGFAGEIADLEAKWTRTKATTEQRTTELKQLMAKYEIPFGDVGTLVGQAFAAGFLGSLQTVFNTLAELENRIRQANQTERLGPTVASAIAGAKGGTALIRLLPGFAGGVRNFSGGLAVVGERGPELVDLPGGSSVYPNGVAAPGEPGGDLIIMVGDEVLARIARRALQRRARGLVESTVIPSQGRLGLA